MNRAPGLNLPAYFSYYKSPVKLVPTPEGGLAAWRLSTDTGGWEPAIDIVDEILFARGGEISSLTADQFVQRTESLRARYLSGTGPIFALYETVQAIQEAAGAEGRRLAATEIALITGIRRKTFIMFEEQLRSAGDPAADPSLAAA
ncbi:hypothetical protein M2302_002330 [Micromonospora sp. A200]|uniref:hypothetical protein n=1 Tax=Micromonospora sp. A200 TaxID=2940568 RepID=UPI0024747B2D|nr:hypothetical protein [Micromonospora sp. A200]MDH6462155.1 hypothetical protein [Micromonospora sp. A200]